MFKLYLLCSFVITSLVAQVHDGKVLYDEADCKRCHSDYIYEKDRRKLNTLPELEGRIERCADSYADWFEEDRDSVTDYLNTHYYKFTPQK